MKFKPMRNALDTLGIFGKGNNACRKIDVWLDTSKIDTGLISIYDKILAIEADEFYSCTDSSSFACRSCSRIQSMFSAEILFHRYRRDLSSARHWSGKPEIIPLEEIKMPPIYRKQFSSF
jgi:hypothetical protein